MVDVFIAGCIGAVAPELLRLYQIRLRARRIVFSRFYYAISVLYVLLGGYVAAIFPSVDTPFLGMCIGVGLVPTVNTMAKIAALLSARARAGLSRFGRIDGAPNVGKWGSEPEESAQDGPRKGDFWDFTRAL